MAINNSIRKDSIIGLGGFKLKVIQDSVRENVVSKKVIENFHVEKNFQETDLISDYLKKISKKSCLDDTSSDFYIDSTRTKPKFLKRIDIDGPNFKEKVIEAAKTVNKDENCKNILTKFLEKIHAFKYFTTNRNAEIIDHLEFVELEANERIFSKNQRAKHAYFQIEGKIGYVPPNFLQKLPESGVPINHAYFIGYYESYDMLGIWETLFSQNRQMTCVATEKTYLLRLKEESVKLFIGENLKRLLREAHQKLKGIIYFKDWNECELAIFLDHLKLQKYPNNKTLYEAGNNDDSIYIINKGSVKIMYKYHTEDNMPVVNFPDPRQESTQANNEIFKIIAAEQLQNKVKKINDTKAKNEELKKNIKNEDRIDKHDKCFDNIEFVVKQKNKPKYGYSCQTTITEGETFGDEESIMNFSNVKRFCAIAAESNTQVYKIDKRDFHQFASSAIAIYKIDKYCKDKMTRRIRYIAEKLERIANKDEILGSMQEKLIREKVMDMKKSKLSTNPSDLNKILKSKNDVDYQLNLDKMDKNIKLFHNDKKNTIMPYYLEKHIHNVHTKCYGKFIKEDFSTVYERDKFGELENPELKPPPPIFSYKDFTDPVAMKLSVAKKFSKAQVNKSRFGSNSVDMVSNISYENFLPIFTERNYTANTSVSPQAKHNYFFTHVDDYKLNSRIDHETSSLSRMTKIIKEKSYQQEAWTTRSASKILKKKCKFRKTPKEPELNFSHVSDTKTKGIKFAKEIRSMLDATYNKINLDVNITEQHLGLNRIRSTEKFKLKPKNSISQYKKPDENSFSKPIQTELSLISESDDQEVRKVERDIYCSPNKRSYLIQELKKKNRKKRSINGIPFISEKFNERTTLEGYRSNNINRKGSPKNLPPISKRKEKVNMDPGNWKQKLMESLKVIKNPSDTSRTNSPKNNLDFSIEY